MAIYGHIYIGHISYKTKKGQAPCDIKTFWYTEVRKNSCHLTTIRASSLVHTRITHGILALGEKPGN